MADARHFCPDCGNIELIVAETTIITDDRGAEARCPNCSWVGPLTGTIGAVSSEQFWDLSRISNVLLRVVSKYAAAPFVQVMEFVGLMPKIEYEGVPADDWEESDYERAREVRKNNQIVEEARDNVLKAMIGAAITAGFEEAEKQHRVWAVKMNKPLHHVLQADPKDEKVFGGNIISMGERKLKKRKKDRR